jgi:uncharacterized protein YigA (DUF484 family)
VPHVAVRLWRVAEENPETKEFAAVAGEMREFVEKMPARTAATMRLRKPGLVRRGRGPPQVLRAGAASSARDMTFGVVALASEDPKRFYPRWGPLYLARIGELMSHALWRFVTPVRAHAA